MGRFIVDTSVWIDFFRGSLRSAIKDPLEEGIRLRIAALTDVIRHELLVGTRSESQFRDLRRLLSPLDCFPILVEDREPFEYFAWVLRKRGFKGKYTDASIAFLCARHDIPLLTFDGYFQALFRKKIIRPVPIPS